MINSTNPAPRTSAFTQAGTPCARSWSDVWIATVTATESELNHRICGARLPDATPCTNQSDHASGRCKFHGGHDLIGAPRGNRNATIHGLYSRRLRTCTPNCPYWQSCPCATPEIADMPPDNAPTCPYQLTEYNTVVTDALAIVESQPHPNPMGIHAAHNVAMLQVLVNTAAAQLANGATGARASSPCSCDSDNANPNATLAFIRLMREFRAAMRFLYVPANTPLFRQKNNFTPPSPDGIMRHARRTQHDTGIDPDSLADAQIEPQAHVPHAKAYLQQAIHAASQGRDVEMSEAFDNVIQLDEHLAKSERDHVLASYRPAKQSVSEQLAAAILGNLHLPPLPENEERETEVSPDSREDNFPEADSAVIQQYLAIFRDGKIPPEAFPIDTTIRACAEDIYAETSDRTGVSASENETRECSPP